MVASPFHRLESNSPLHGPDGAGVGVLGHGAATGKASPSAAELIELFKQAPPQVKVCWPLKKGDFALYDGNVVWIEAILSENKLPGTDHVPFLFDGYSVRPLVAGGILRKRMNVMKEFVKPIDLSRSNNPELRNLIAAWLKAYKSNEDFNFNKLLLRKRLPIRIEHPLYIKSIYRRERKRDGCQIARNFLKSLQLS